VDVAQAAPRKPSVVRRTAFAATTERYTLNWAERRELPEEQRPAAWVPAAWVPAVQLRAAGRGLPERAVVMVAAVAAVAPALVDDPRAR
jgi:hypothetical protein